MSPRTTETQRHFDNTSNSIFLNTHLRKFCFQYLKSWTGDSVGSSAQRRNELLPEEKFMAVPQWRNEGYARDPEAH